MDEFLKMIYESWNKENEDRPLYFEKGSEMMEELEKVLSLDLVNEIYEKFCDSSEETEKKAFISGFKYACKVLSIDKIKLD